MAPRAERVFPSSCESLNEGHGDKSFDQVSDAVLVGFDPFIDDLSCVGSKALIYKDCEVLVRINKQSPVALRLHRREGFASTWRLRPGTSRSGATTKSPTK